MEMTIQYLDPPKAGKKLWSAKDVNGNRYFVDETFAPQLEPLKNTSTNLAIKPAPWNKDQSIITGFDNGGAPSQPEPPPPVTTPPPPQPAPQPAPQANPDAQKHEDMFVMGVVGRAMGSGAFKVEEIPALTNQAVKAWRGRGGTEAPF